MEQTYIEQITRELATNPVWQVRAMKSIWICPFCAEPGAKSAPALEDMVPAVQRHFDRCPNFRQFQGKPLTVPALRHKALLMELANNLSTQPVWRVVAPNSYWICPFCAKITDVRFPKGTARVDVGVLQGILAHLNGCPDHDGGRGRIRPIEEIRKIITGVIEQKRMISDIRQKLAAVESWRIKDHNENWVCPYCRTAIAGIFISSQFLLMESAPALIVRHLRERCQPYRKGAKPCESADELRDAVNIPTAEPAQPAPAKAPAADAPSAWIKSIEAELRDMKSRSELSKDVERGLEEARKKQLEMLPAPPAIEGFEFATLYKPCTSLGGDFYDFVEVGPREVGIAMGDVSGHGIEAAIVMSMVKKLLNVHGRGKSFAGATLRATNRDIYGDLDGRTFVTVLYGVINTEKRTFNFVRAGHTLPILFNPARKPDIQELNSAGMVVGVDRGSSFEAVLEEKEIELQSGDVILIYTDGLNETMDPRGEILGEEKICEWVRKFGNYDTEYLLHRVDLAANEFRGGGPQSDDIAMVAIKVK